MKYFSQKDIKLFIMLFILWLILAGSIDLRQIVSGLIASLLTLWVHKWLLRHGKIKPVPAMRPIKWLNLLWLSIKVLGLSAWYHIFRIASGDEDVIFLEIILDTTHPYENAIIANIITLTPGAVTVDLDDQVLKVLSYKPRNDKEHVLFYQLLDELQSAFRR